MIAPRRNGELARGTSGHADEATPYQPFGRPLPVSGRALTGTVHRAGIHTTGACHRRTAITFALGLSTLFAIGAALAGGSGDAVGAAGDGEVSATAAAVAPPDAHAVLSELRPDPVTTTTVAPTTVPVPVSLDAATVVAPATRLEPPPPRPSAAESSFTSTPTGAPYPDLGTPICVDADTVDALAAVFDAGGPLIGADYQRAFPLPDGRVLWLFQDAFLATSNGPELVHNIGLLQGGSCFQLLHSGSADAPTSYLFPELTDRYDRWFWPLGGEVGTDGNLHVFVAEMVEHSSGYLEHTEPVATWLVTIDPTDLTVIDQRLAPDGSAELHGWSVVSHGEHTYLYAHCYRQFGWGLLPFADPPPKVHDWSCTSDVTVARVPRGRFDATPEYWDGTGWNDDAAAAVPVFPAEGRSVNPVQVGVLDGQFVAVTMVGDWWRHDVYLDVAPTPHGPWQTYETITIEPQCSSCNTYFASIVPFGNDPESFAIALSNNTWGGHDLPQYRPTVHRVPTP